MPERTALELFRELSDFVNGAEGSAESAEVIGLRAAIRSALDTVKNALRLYGSQKLVCSFNGGKDATVLLHLVRCAYADFFQVEDPGGRVKCVYWKEDNEFEEVQHFVDDLVLEYKLDMHVFSSGFKRGLQESIDNTGAQAFLLGTRRGDPNGETASEFEPSSLSWPAFMRVNPLLQWNYRHVWMFLRRYHLPYCLLYDRGYTSLGNKSNTRPNPALLVPQTGLYRPAHELVDGQLERCGRQAANGVVDPTGAPALPHDFRTVPQPRSVGLLVIGDEIMKGKIGDENVRLACEQLFRRGVRVRRVSMVGDDMEEISSELRTLCHQCDLVITSGGVGPTHDDITIEAIAGTVGRPLVVSKEMRRILEDFAVKGSAQSGRNDVAATGPLLNEAQLKMCKVPEGATVATDGHTYPLLSLGKIFVLPGVPTFFAEKLRLIMQRHFRTSSGVSSVIVRFRADEHILAGPLNMAVAEHPAAVFGSYPRGNGCTAVTIEADSASSVEDALGTLVANLPEANRTLERLPSLDAGD